MSIEIENAVIDRAVIGLDRDIFVTAWLYLSYEHASQGFGGFCLHNTRNLSGGDWAGVFIGKVLKLVEVDSWDDLPGKTIRVERSGSTITRIGNIIKDVWFDPKEAFESYKPYLPAAVVEAKS